MRDAAKLAFGILLLWIAGVLLFIAFHPGGVLLADGKPAGNPVDVFKYILSNRQALGDFGKDTSSGKTVSTTGGVPAPTTGRNTSDQANIDNGAV